MSKGHLRIIAGSRKNFHIFPPPGNATRPMTDRRRESIFSMIHPMIENSIVGDLFAGSGIFGLECLSRGARSCLFVENGHQAVTVLKSNILKTGFEKESVVCTGSVFTSQNFILKDFGQPDILFADPPFPRKWGSRILDWIISEDILHSETIFILECSIDEQLQIPDRLNLTRTREYGVTRTYFFQSVKL